MMIFYFSLLQTCFSLPTITRNDQATVLDFTTKNSSSNPNYSTLSLFMVPIIAIGGVLLVVLIVLFVFIVKLLISKNRSVKLENTIPGSIDDEFEIEQRLLELSPNEQHLFRAGRDYIQQFPPVNEQLTLSTHLIIQEKGIEAWEFIPDPNLPNDCIIINDKTEITFTSYDYQCSIQSNLPILKVNDVYYFEAKIFNFESPEDSIISIGLATKPYPYFRLPGRHLYSIAYDSNGSRRVNNSFKLTEAESSVFPPLQQGDVVGIGYRVRSGTIFFTRNGKKLSEKSVGGHIKGMKMNNIFPIIGTNNPCSIHVNMGHAGYVFIEANVKKWGFAAKEGTRPPLPDYNFSSQDLLLESSNEDDDDIINPPDFTESAGYESANTSVSSLLHDNITLNTLMPPEPPTYQEEMPENRDEVAARNAETNQFVGTDDIPEEDMPANQEELEVYEERSRSSLLRDDSSGSV